MIFGCNSGTEGFSWAGKKLGLGCRELCRNFEIVLHRFVPIGRNMKLSFSKIVVGLWLGWMPAWTLAQISEPESVDKFRKSYDFVMPSAGSPSNGNAVVVVNQPAGPAGVHYFFDARVQKLLDLHKKGNEGASEVEGFRIQIYAGGDQNLANEARADFMAKFAKEGYEIHQTWDPPHFRVRVGDFRTRAEAMNALPNIRRIFPDGFVVADRVKLRKSKRLYSPAPEGQPVQEDGKAPSKF